MLSDDDFFEKTSSRPCRKKGSKNFSVTNFTVEIRWLFCAKLHIQNFETPNSLPNVGSLQTP
jgi:hypothetical protein